MVSAIAFQRLSMAALLLICAVALLSQSAAASPIPGEPWWKKKGFTKVPKPQDDLSIHWREINKTGWLEKLKK